MLPKKCVFLGVGASVVMAIVTFKNLRLVTTDGGKLLWNSGRFLANCVRLVFLSDCLAVELVTGSYSIIPQIEIHDQGCTKKYLGFFGDSMIMGLVIGMVIGALAGYDIKAVLQLGCQHVRRFGF
ncbi:hypothetical protein JG559_01120 [Enterococcus faecalis]|uniref:Uncharacterized protein n=1 Tax=Enterococcus faecalis TaxID=1351 RepID=A0A974NZA3_ENTFL|nr:hypothetical protein JG559_01120 [Enterococcus faecalis]